MYTKKSKKSPSKNYEELETDEVNEDLKKKSEKKVVKINLEKFQIVQNN